MRIAIVAPGGVGGTFGGRLAKAGAEVVALARGAPLTRQVPLVEMTLRSALQIFPHRSPPPPLHPTIPPNVGHPSALAMTRTEETRCYRPSA